MTRRCGVVVFKLHRTVFAHANAMATRNTSSRNAGDEFLRLNDLFRQVGDSATDNCSYFSIGQKPIYNDFYHSFTSILNVLNPLQISVEAVTGACPKFDISPSCKGNGYRSIVNIIESCLEQILRISLQIQHTRDKFFFRSYHMYMDIESHSQVLSRLLTIVHLALVLIDTSKVGNLFPEADITAEVMADFEAVNRECFYGRSFGFQFVESLKKPLSFLQTAMAAFGDGFIRHNNSFSRALSSMIHSGKYVVDPELRAKRIIELTQNASVEFCRAFWGLTEEYGVRHVPLIMCPALAVNHEFVIPPEPLAMETLDGGSVVVILPLTQPNQKGVNARLLSFTGRDGQAFNYNATKQAGGYSSLGQRARTPSRCLVFHCHGGGFVAQSSKSHEIYLRHWAKELNVPILSIDYSLAPDAPFPQALNEVFFAYCWALQNLDRLGSTGERICFCGDSAGANLVTAVVLKAIRENIRLPDGLVLAYPPFNVQFVASPSRLLSLMDPLLPIGILKACLAAYAGSYVAAHKSDVCQIPVRTARFNEVFNPYDIDLGPPWAKSSHRFASKCQSLSDSNLVLMKSRTKETSFASTEDGSYYSDFPCSSSTSSSSARDASALEDSHDRFNEGIVFDAKAGSRPNGGQISRELVTRLKSEAASDGSFYSCEDLVAKESPSENVSPLRRASSLPYSAFVSLTSSVSSATRGVASYILGSATTANTTANARSAEVLHGPPLPHAFSPALHQTLAGEINSKTVSVGEVELLDKKITFDQVNPYEMSEVDLEYVNMEVLECVVPTETQRCESRNDSSAVETTTTESRSSIHLSDSETLSEADESVVGSRESFVGNGELVVGESVVGSGKSLADNGKSVFGNVESAVGESVAGSGNSVAKFSICRDCLRPTGSCKVACVGESEQPALERRRRRRYSAHHRHLVHERHQPRKEELPAADRQVNNTDTEKGASSRVGLFNIDGATVVRSRSTSCLSDSSFEDLEEINQGNPCITVDVTKCLLSKADSHAPLDGVKTQRNARISFSKRRTSNPQAATNLGHACKEPPSGLRDHLAGPSTEEILKEAGKDPLISPLLASDEALRKMPPVFVVACSLDPLFDDSVEFVRKMRRLDKDAELFVLDKLPHGFLNLQVLSAEAREGCDLLIACIKKAVGLGMRRNDSSVSPCEPSSSSSSLD